MTHSNAARLADLPPDAEVNCSHCGESQLACALEDLAGKIALVGVECEVCADAAALLVADLHDDESCDCSMCERAEKILDRKLRALESDAFGGGLRQDLNWLFGPGWEGE